ncbi:MAG TPA: RNA methyltransferase [Burkholderiales bacterium]|nr:RNA methyltransferase [Burkholderiales bacterium]
MESADSIMSGAPLLDRVRVVLCDTTHPGNIGAAARALKTMGLTRLYLVAPRHFPDAEADARASNARDVLERAQVCESLEHALYGTVFAAALTARSRELGQPTLAPRAAAPLLLAEAQAGDVALVFGRESSGLTREQVNLCQRILHIPANPEYSSLNLAAAVQIMTYELRVAAGAGGLPASEVHEPATFEEVEAFHLHLDEVMRETGFLDPRKPRRLSQRMRRLFTRARLEKEEVSLLRGLLKAMQAQREAD